MSAGYERASVILTSDKGFSEWGELLGDTVIALPVQDRLLDHSHVLNIRRESYRLREKTTGWALRLASPVQGPHPRMSTTTIRTDGITEQEFGRVNSKPAALLLAYDSDTGSIPGQR